MAPRHDGPFDRTPAWAPLAAVIATATAINAPWIARNLVVYGDLEGTKAFRLFPTIPGSRIGGWRILLGVHPSVRHAKRFWPELGRGGVGVLRWSDLHLPAWAYLLSLVVATAGAIAAIGWLRRVGAASADRRAALVVLAAALASVAGAVWFAITVDYQPQGRYVLPAVLALVGLGGAAVGRRGFALGAATLVALLGAALATTVHAFGLP